MGSREHPWNDATTGSKKGVWTMATGQIKNLVRDRGFGFIKPSEGSEDVFFHSTSVTGGGFDELKEGQTVEFDTEADPRNPQRTRAANVRTTS